MNNVLFLGGVFPKHLENDIIKKSKGNVQFAANNLQWKIIGGIEANLKNSIDVATLMFIGSYPKRYNDLFIPSFEFSHSPGAEDFSIGYLNLTGIKQLIFRSCMKKPIEKWIKKRNGNATVVIYSMQVFFLDLAKYIKRKYPNTHIHLIVPDLPQYMSMHQNGFIFNKIKSKNTSSCKKNTRWCDSFTLLTDHMAEKMEIQDKPYVVVEGMVDSGDMSENNIYIQQNENIKTIVYTGTLTRKYGVLDLVNAFMLIEDDTYRLIICGGGETRAEIEEMALKDKRIQYKGMLSPSEIKKIQTSATVLINPRKNDEEYTKYSFPSKMMEYLYSGRPVVCYRLDGFPAEYDDYFLYVPDNSLEALKNKIVEVCSMDKHDLEKIGKKGKYFVVNDKNCEIQCKKIVDLVLDGIDL